MFNRGLQVSYNDCVKQHTFKLVLVIVGAGLLFAALSRVKPPVPDREGRPVGDKVVKSDAEWRTQLTPEQFAVARKHGTERLHRRILGLSRGRHVRLCLLRPAAIR